MNQWDFVRNLARSKRLEIDKSAEGETASDLISAAAQLTQIQCVGLPQEDPLLYGSEAVLDAAAKRIWYNKETDPLLLGGYLIHEYAHYWIEGENCSCTSPDFEARLSEEKSPMGTDRVENYNPKERREALANVFAREFLLPANRLQLWFVHENQTASQIASYVGVTENLVFNQLTDILLLSQNGDEEAEKNTEVRRLATGLDSSQSTSAYVTEGPLLVEAGPGTGKTRTLIGRIEFLVTKQNVDPQSILVLTFSNKAAEEMRGRLAQVLPDVAPTIWMGTFHAFGLELLRKYGYTLGLPTSPKLLDPISAILFMEQLLPKMTLNHYQDLYEPARYVPDFLKAISRAKDELVTPERYRQMAIQTTSEATDDEERERAEKILEVAGIYEVYQSHLDQEKLIDFGDLISKSVQLLVEHPDVQQDVSKTFGHILVDEYQDVNRACARLLQQLAGDGKGLWVVGDARQSIYRFRGASPQNMALFPQDFPGSKTVQLQVNYRSQPLVIKAFSTLASEMKTSTVLPFSEWEANRPDESGAVLLKQADNLESEGESIAKEIRRLVEQGILYKDQAILCRSHTQLAKMAELMERHGIPTLYIGDLFERNEIQDLLALISLVTGDARGLVRVSRFPEYRLSSTDVHNLLSLAEEGPIYFPEAIDQFKNDPAISAAGQRTLQLLGRHLQNQSKIYRVWYFLADYLFNHSSYLRTIMHSDGNSNYRQRIAIYQFLRFTYEQDRLPANRGNPKLRMLDYVRRLEIHGEEKQLRQIPEVGHSLNAVRLLTIHGSKGLEFRAIYIPMLGKGLFPSKIQAQVCHAPKGLLAQDIRDVHIEEETCLFFVAMSRARDVLCLSRSTRYNERSSNPSEFVSLISSTAVTQDVHAATLDAAHAGVDVAPDLQEDFKTVASHEFEVDQLDLYLHCPRRYYYDLVLGFSRNTADSPFLRFHRCVYQVLGWIVEKYIQTGTVDVSMALDKLEALWPTTALGGHPFDAVYRKTAENMVVTAMQMYSGSRKIKKSERIRLQLKNGTVYFSPDHIEINEGGRLVFRRIRSGRMRKDEADQRVYGLYHAAAKQIAKDAYNVEVVFLTSETTMPIQLTDQKVASKLDEYDQAMLGISVGMFPPRPVDKRQCPRCPNYFMCPAIPTKQSKTV
jgi:DNA helicase II / ATP-dependent DNA helicase PcrA